MKRERVRFIGWFLFIVIFFIFSDSYFSFLMFTLFLLITIIDFIYSRLIKDKLIVQLRIPEVLKKENNITGHLEVKNTGFLPIPKIKCVVLVENILTQEKQDFEIYFSTHSNEEKTVEFNLSNIHCGKHKIYISKLISYDFFGVFSLENKLSIVTYTFVVPEHFDVNLKLLEDTLKRNKDSENYRENRSQQPYEISGLREYLDGDNIKNIHWKMTSKLDTLTVKEYHLTTNKKVLVLLDTAIPIFLIKDIALVIDSMYEVFISICKSFIDEGEVLNIGSYDYTEENLIYDEVDCHTKIISFMLNNQKIFYTDVTFDFIEVYLKEFSHVFFITAQSVKEKYNKENMKYNEIRCLSIKLS